jgi:hypothetical protein
VPDPAAAPRPVTLPPGLTLHALAAGGRRVPCAVYADPGDAAGRRVAAVCAAGTAGAAVPLVVGGPAGEVEAMAKRLVGSGYRDVRQEAGS